MTVVTDGEVEQFRETPITFTVAAVKGPQPLSHLIQRQSQLNNA